MPDGITYAMVGMALGMITGVQIALALVSSEKPEKKRKEKKQLKKK